MIFKKIMTLKATIGAITKNSVNPFYKKKYANIDDWLSQIAPCLEDQNLLLIQPIEVIGESGMFENVIHTRIIDLDSGEEIESKFLLPFNDDPQSVGGLVSYYRRYALASLLGMPQDDDDANRASGKKVDPSPPQSDPVKKIWLSKDQFEIAMNATEKQIRAVLEAFNGSGEKFIRKDYREKLEKQIESLITQNQ